jgi:hypothetical protein
MQKFAVVLLCLLGVACAGEGQSSEEPVDITSEELKKGAYHGGSGGLLLGNTPYGDCLTECSQAKQSCENENSRRDPDDLMEPCDLNYSFCKGDCQDAFPQ